jgi:hypothetical protein
MFSLLGVTHSAFATTLFGIKLDFQDGAGAYAGGGFIQFSVDPMALPFDQWIDLSTVSGLEMDFWVSNPVTHEAYVWSEKDLADLNTKVYFHNNDPLFPVEWSIAGTGHLMDLYTAYGGGGQLLQMAVDGGHGYTGDIGMVDTNSSTGVFNMRWTSNAWFDDPIPASVVPEPAAFWLFGAGLVGLIAVARRRRA